MAVGSLVEVAPSATPSPRSPGNPSGASGQGGRSGSLRQMSPRSRGLVGGRAEGFAKPKAMLNLLDFLRSQDPHLQSNPRFQATLSGSAPLGFKAPSPVVPYLRRAKWMFS